MTSDGPHPATFVGVNELKLPAISECVTDWGQVVVVGEQLGQLLPD